MYCIAGELSAMGQCARLMFNYGPFPTHYYTTEKDKMPDKISLAKKYKCVNAAEVRLSFIMLDTGVSPTVVIGAVRDNVHAQWRAAQWDSSGNCPGYPSYNLVEIKPKVKIAGFIAIDKRPSSIYGVANDTSHMYRTREQAERHRAPGYCHIIEIIAEVDAP